MQFNYIVYSVYSGNEYALLDVIGKRMSFLSLSQSVGASYGALMWPAAGNWNLLLLLALLHQSGRIQSQLKTPGFLGFF